MTFTASIQKWLDSNGAYQVGVAYLVASKYNPVLAERLAKKETQQNRTELKVALRKYLNSQAKADKKAAISDFLNSAKTTVESYNPATAETEKKRKNSHFQLIQGIQRGGKGRVQSAASLRANARTHSSGCCNG